MSSFDMDAQALQAFAANPATGPVVMLNLLKFKRGGGSKSYARYSDGFSKLLEAHGGRFLYMGRAAEMLTGEQDWDAVALVEYPSRKVFMEVTQSAAYAAIAPFRKDGLERTVLYATDPR